MKNNQLRGLLWLIIVCIVIGWPLTQLLSKEKIKQDPLQMLRLLHQVSTFQVEVLSNQWLDSVQAQTYDELRVLYQAAYSVNYTHQRLMLALAIPEVVPLSSVEQLLQYVTHLEMSGKRNLDPEDSVLLEESAKEFSQLLQVYPQLIANNGKLIRSKNEEALRYDQQIQAIFQAKLLE